jgi:predicted NAD-dependent protein-ADP-ribosyltransferase YbiA (DUF1768 family)
MAATLTPVKFADYSIKRIEHPSPLYGYSEHAIYDATGRRFPTLIHFFWAHKHLDDAAWVARITGAETTYAANHMIIESREANTSDWILRRDGVLCDGIRRKVSLHRDAFDALVQSEGVILSADNYPFGPDFMGDVYTNTYGNALMDVRNDCRQGHIPRPEFESSLNLAALRARNFIL